MNMRLLAAILIVLVAVLIAWVNTSSGQVVCVTKTAVKGPYEETVSADELNVSRAALNHASPAACTLYATPTNRSLLLVLNGSSGTADITILGATVPTGRSTAIRQYQLSAGDTMALKLSNLTGWVSPTYTRLTLQATGTVTDVSFALLTY